MSDAWKDAPPKKETTQTRAGEPISGFGDVISSMHEHGKTDRQTARDVAKSIGAEMMDGAKDLTGKMADAASKVTKEAAQYGTKAASVAGKNAEAAAKAAGDFATQATDTAGKVATDTADAAAKVAASAAESASDVAEKADAVADQAVQQLLEKAKSEADEWQDRFIRLHAEWDTYRRRISEQRSEEKARATEGLVGNLLPVLDDFERSIDYAVKNGEGDLLVGVQQVHAKLVDVLTKNGVEIIDPEGQPFDALEAQAVAKVDRTDVPDETVDEVYQKGYKMGRKVVRPAMVTVTTDRKSVV